MNEDKKSALITLNPGEGLSSMRALWAAIMGPYRLAMSRRQPVLLTNTEGTEIAKNIGVADAYVFIGVALPQNAAVNPLQVIFSRDGDSGRNTGLPCRLVDSVNQSFSFMQLLLPGEQLYCQITDINVPQASVVVAEAVF